MAALQDFTLTPANIHKALRGSATPADIEASLEFLLKKKFLKSSRSPGKYIQEAITFQPHDDIRRIDLQRSHMRFLEMAKHKINMDIEDREFQGLTVAIPQDKFGLIKDRLRDFIRSLNEDLTDLGEADRVVRVQLCAFPIASIDDQEE
jgi:hypothetical protein